MRALSELVQVKSDFRSQIYPFTMTFKNPNHEKKDHKYKFEKKNLLVLLGITIYFNLFLIGLRSIQASLNTFFDFRVTKLPIPILITYVILNNIPIIIEAIIYHIKRLSLLRGFAINLFPMIAIIITSNEYCSKLYFTSSPMFISVTIIYLPISFITSLVYAANWSLGAIQISLYNIILIIGVILMPGDFLLDKSWYILMIISAALSLSITLYYFEYFQRKSIYLKIQANLQKKNLENILDMIPEPFIISNQGQIQYANSIFKSLRIDNTNNHRDNLDEAISTNVFDIDNIQNNYQQILKRIVNRSSGDNLFTLMREQKSIPSKKFCIVNNSDEIVKSFEISVIPISFISEEMNIYYMKDLTSFEKLKEIELREKYHRQYIASITHDFRTPLGIILGNSEILSYYLKDEQSSQHLTNITNAASILSLLVQDLLDYAQLKVDNLKLSPIEFDLIKEVNGVINLFIDKYRDKDLYIKLNLINEIPITVFNDANRIKQILMNLISNAYKFTTTGGVMIQVENLEDTNSIAISVIDTGIGMDEDDLKKLFSEYCRIEKHNAMNPSGIGLGLHICKKIVELLGGQINVKSKLMYGTQFTFTFLKFLQDKTRVLNKDTVNCDLVNLQNNSKIRRNNEEEKSDKAIAFSSRGMMDKNVRLFSNCFCSQILIVDDDPSIRNIMKSFCTKCQIRYDEAQNGLKAVELVKEKMKSDCCKYYQFIFMDNEMPVLDGLKASRMIQADLQLINHDSKIVIVTGLEPSLLNLEEGNEKCPFYRIEGKPLIFKKFKEIIYS